MLFEWLGDDKFCHLHNLPLSGCITCFSLAMIKHYDYSKQQKSLFCLMAPEVYRIRHGRKPASRNRKLRAHIHNCQRKVMSKLKVRESFYSQNPLPVAYFLQQSHSLTAPNSITNWRQGIQISGPMGMFSFKPLQGHIPAPYRSLCFWRPGHSLVQLKNKNILHLPLNALHFFSPISHKLLFFPKDKAY